MRIINRYISTSSSLPTRLHDDVLT